jgi:hypothetical protein
MRNEAAAGLWDEDLVAEFLSMLKTMKQVA